MTATSKSPPSSQKNTIIINTPIDKEVRNAEERVGFNINWYTVRTC